MQCRFIIARFEIYPADQPKDYLVGFKIICDGNGTNGYVESFVPLDQVRDKSEHEICVAAYHKAKEKIDDTVKRMVSVPAVLGAEFVPPPDAGDEK